jgi:hypothetical protein
MKLTIVIITTYVLALVLAIFGHKGYLRTAYKDYEFEWRGSMIEQPLERLPILTPESTELVRHNVEPD